MKFFVNYSQNMSKAKKNYPKGLSRRKARTNQFEPNSNNTIIMIIMIKFINKR